MVSLGTDERVHAHLPTTWNGRPAVLTLTSRRLVVSRRTGLPRRRDRTLLSIEWAEVRRTSVEERGSVLVVVAAGRDEGDERRVEVAVEDPLKVQRTVDRLIEQALARARARATPPSGEAPAVHLHLTLHQPPGSPGPVYVRCSYCRTVYPELAGKCPSCGAPF